MTRGSAPRQIRLAAEQRNAFPGQIGCAQPGPPFACARTVWEQPNGMKYAVSVMLGLTTLGLLPAVLVVATTPREEGAIIGLPFILWPGVGIATAIGGWLIARQQDQQPERTALRRATIAVAVLAACLGVLLVSAAIGGAPVWIVLYGPLSAVVLTLPPALAGAVIGAAIGHRRRAALAATNQADGPP